VSRYAVATARRLGLGEAAVEQIRIGGELHDIGKIGTREAVLQKPGALTEEERHQICAHPVLGERMLAPLARESPGVLRVVRSHHERVDGAGFPDGLQGEGIPLEARIVAVADAFDAMTSERPYRAPRAPAAALHELRQVSGTQLDAEAVDAFAAALGDPATLPAE
jgi:HD-GYP domain-containing protein (c-di-GMP phosphodiesterase class II)